MCLGVAQFGEARINNARITPGGAEMQVELALAVAQQDHAGGHNRRPKQAARAAGGGIPHDGFRDSFVLAPACAYL